MGDKAILNRSHKLVYALDPQTMTRGLAPLNNDVSIKPPLN